MKFKRRSFIASALGLLLPWNFFSKDSLRNYYSYDLGDRGYVLDTEGNEIAYTIECYLREGRARQLLISPSGKIVESPNHGSLLYVWNTYPGPLRFVSSNDANKQFPKIPKNAFIAPGRHPSISMSVIPFEWYQEELEEACQ